MEEIARLVANYYKVPIYLIKSQNKKKDINNARHITSYLIRTNTNESWARIGEFLDNRTHATIFHSYKLIYNELEVSQKLKKEISELEELIKLAPKPIKYCRTCRYKINYHA